MRCLFCKRDSAGSRSVEHILPESLGNTTRTLKPGIVCDKCNNYFSRDVERPFLEAPAIAALRFHQSIPSKRGRIPPLGAVLMPGIPATLHRFPKHGIQAVSFPPEGIDSVLRKNGGTLLFTESSAPPSDLVISRFLAKVALEAMAERLQEHLAGLEYLVDEAQLDEIRRHAREGFPKVWPHSARRIYDADRHFVDENGKEAQTVHESDILVTHQDEYYFVLAIFGLELAINYGGPEIEGYLRWLQASGGTSPLYSGKNADLLGPG